MNIPKFFSLFRSLFLWEKISENFKATALYAANFMENYNREVIKNRKYFWVGSSRSYTIPAGIPGSGAGKGGGSGGSVRESGGGLGRYGAAQETGYFLKKERELLAKIKKKMKQETQHSDSSQKRKK